MSDIFDFYKDMKQKNVLLAYKGNVSDHLFGSLLKLAEDKLEKIESKATLKKKVFNILVEVLQNIYHHVEDYTSKDDDFFSIVLMLVKHDKGYLIVTGNPVRLDKMQSLKKRLDKINSLSKDELRDYYRDRLDKGSFSKKGGAGLGLMDIVRKAGKSIKYEFKPMENGYSFFSLQVQVQPE